MFNLTIKLLCTSKAGTLSKVIRQLKNNHVSYQNHSIKHFEKSSQVTLNCLCEKAVLNKQIETLLIDLPEVLQILEIILNGKALNKSPKKPRINAVDSQHKLLVNYKITPIVVKMTERRLMRLVGPVAPILVKKALETSRNIGELYYKLSKDIKEDDIDYFLSVLNLDND